MSIHSTRSYDVRSLRFVKRVINDRLKVKSGEHVLIVADYATEKEKIDAFASAVVEAGAIPTIIVLPNAWWDKSNPLSLTKPAEKAYFGADVLILITDSSTSSLWGGEEWKKHVRQEKKARVFAATEFPWNLLGLYDVEMEEIEKMFEVSEKIARLVQVGKGVRIVGKGGTDITAQIHGLGAESLFHLIPEFHPEIPKVRWEIPQGGVGILGCEVDLVPVAGTAEGTVVWDGPVSYITRHPVEPIKLTVKNGKVVDVDGGFEAMAFNRLLAQFENLDQIIEMSVGTTPWWVPDGSIHNEKRGLGNCHVTCGGWYSELLSPDHLPCKLHVDGTIYRGTFEIDGKRIVEDGKIYM